MITTICTNNIYLKKTNGLKATEVGNNPYNMH